VPAVLAVAMPLLELTSLDMDIAKLFYNACEGGFVGRAGMGRTFFPITCGRRFSAG
jgi:hypothetical protein